MLTNVGAETADAVRVFVGDRTGRARTDFGGRLRRGESIEVCLCTADPASAVVTVAWYRGRTDEQYLWRFVL